MQDCNDAHSYQLWPRTWGIQTHSASLPCGFEMLTNVPCSDTFKRRPMPYLKLPQSPENDFHCFFHLLCLTSGKDFNPIRFDSCLSAASHAINAADSRSDHSLGGSP